MNFLYGHPVSPREDDFMDTDLNVLVAMLDPLLSSLECEREGAALAWKESDDSHRTPARDLDGRVRRSRAPRQQSAAIRT